MNAAMKETEDRIVKAARETLAAHPRMTVKRAIKDNDEIGACLTAIVLVEREMWDSGQWSARLRQLETDDRTLAEFLAAADAVTVNVSLPIERKRIDDLLCCAFEGGSTYWCDRVEVIGDWPAGAEYAHEVLTRGGVIHVHYEDGEEEVTADALPRALELMAKEHPHQWADFMRENEDAITGDVFFQLLCLGEVVYG